MPKNLQPLLAKVQTSLLDFAVACLLAFAAFGKIWVLATDDLATLSLGFPMLVLVPTICIELAVAGILITKSSTIIKSAVSLLLFGCFSVVSFFRLQSGEATCGCYGIAEFPLKQSLWICYGITLISAIRLRLRCHGNIRHVLSRELRGILFHRQAALGSFEAPIVELGDLALGATTPLRFTLRNRAEKPIRVTGIKSTCGCLVR